MRKKKCASQGCRKAPKAGRYCYSCTKRQYAQRHPVKYAYQVLRSNARRRKVIVYDPHYKLGFLVEQSQKPATECPF